MKQNCITTISVIVVHPNVHVSSREAPLGYSMDAVGMTRPTANPYFKCQHFHRQHSAKYFHF